MTLELVELPDVVIVHLLSYLNGQDRLNLSLTCESLNSRFNHPSLWRCLNLKFVGNYREENPVKKNTEHIDQANRVMEKLTRVGRYVRELELEFVGCGSPMDEHALRIVSQIVSNAEILESLAVSVIAKRQGATGQLIHSEDMTALLSIIDSCKRLKNFTLRKWPSLNRYNILERIAENQDIVSSIECLNLFWPDRNRSSWAIRVDEMPDNFVLIVGKFRNLLHLSLPSNLITGELLRELMTTPRIKLESLRILVTYTKHDTPPEISPVRWKNFAAFHANVEVDVIFSNRVPLSAMEAILNKDIPVSTLYFMPFARCSPNDVISFTTKYASTLKRYVNLSNEISDEDANEAILNLVNLCPNLHTFVHHGKLNWKTVMRLAKIKGRNWHKFEISEDAVELFDGVVADDDKVIGKVDGEDDYRLLSLEKWCVHQDDAVKYKTMIDTVSDELKQRWHPVKPRPN